MLTQKRLKKILHYSKKTGLFIRKITTCSVAQKGTIAGCSSGKYIIIVINGKNYLAHRLAYFYVKGYWPEHDVDHEDRIRHNNKWKNLKHRTHQCNIRNRGILKNNTSGSNGVCFSKQMKRWKSYIYINYKCYHLGYFKDLEEAVCHRLAAEQCLNWNKGEK